MFFAAFLLLSTGCGDDSAANIKKTAETAVENKVNEVEKDVASKVQDVANDVSQKAGNIANNGAGNVSSAQKVSLGGISLGMTFEEVKNILGEPVSNHDNDEFIFSNGVKVEMDDHRNVVEKIETRQAGTSASGGIAVGMTEQNLLDSYGKPAYEDFDDGAKEYKYFGDDRRQKIVFKIYNGAISEIKCELDD